MSKTFLLSTLLLAFSLPACLDSHSSDHDEEKDHGHAPPSAAAQSSEANSDSHEEHEEDGHIELTATQYSSAGIELLTAGPGEVGLTISMPAVVRPDADTVSHINPVAAGVVSSIHKHLGEKVQAGDLLATVDSVALGSAVASYLETQAMTAAGRRTLERETEMFDSRLATAERVLNGIIAVHQDLYEREQELQAKAVSTIRPLLEADKNLKRATLEKERQLTELQAEREARLLELEVNLTERIIEEQASRNRLLALGLTSNDLDKLADNEALIGGRYEIRAMRPGIIASRHITLGEYVDPADALFTIQDLSRVWVIGSAFEQHLQSVRKQQRAIVSLNVFPEQTFLGEVDLVGFEVNPDSRSIGIRIELDNPNLDCWPEDYPIRPGMFGTVELIVQRKQVDLAIPESALVHGDDGTASVFVAVEDHAFEMRTVQVGLANAEMVEILSGVEPGEQVAVAGVFYLKSVMRQGELGEGHSH
jgi:cobalt-zinc-cadmium efflux system membrane fusion protein